MISNVNSQVQYGSAMSSSSLPEEMSGVLLLIRVEGLPAVSASFVLLYTHEEALVATGSFGTEQKIASRICFLEVICSGSWDTGDATIDCRGLEGCLYEETRGGDGKQAGFNLTSAGQDLTLQTTISTANFVVMRHNMVL